MAQTYSSWWAWSPLNTRRVAKHLIDMNLIIFLLCQNQGGARQSGHPPTGRGSPNPLNLEYNLGFSYLWHFRNSIEIHNSPRDLAI